MAYIEEFIVVSGVVRGTGETGNPYRTNTQLWTKDGQLVVEMDSYTNKWHGEVDALEHR